MSNTADQDTYLAAEWEEVSPADVPAAPTGAATYRVRYTAEGARGSVPMTGLVTVPDTVREGTAILSWAHGTTGLSTKSAPSLHTAGDPIERYITPWTEYLQRWVDEGYIVTQPDYEGLGVEEVGATYMHRGSLASSINRLVEETVDKFEAQPSWLNVGFSQGGYAALSAADDPADGMEATIAIAPGDTELVNKNLRLMGVRPVDVARMLKGTAVRFFPIVIAGALNAFEGVHAEDFLSERGADLVDKAEKLTLPELRDEVADTSGGELFISKANTKPMQDLLDEQRLELMHPQGPVFIVAGDNDTTINRESLKSVIKVWESNGATVEYREVPDATHSDTVPLSYDAQQEWLSARGH
ncbi:S9 family peptidase [uncultured Corynebacterium sp.]|uniref:alpha/beta hydrolase family protein n=1 Tax=uncultured Corynebacterium sp. TaxID=159447 RepID=UPI002591C0DB|nr:lipase family protein [uncultured Corynebacterium sp.]